MVGPNVRNATQIDGQPLSPGNPKQSLVPDLMPFQLVVFHLMSASGGSSAAPYYGSIRTLPAPLASAGREGGLGAAKICPQCPVPFPTSRPQTLRREGGPGGRASPHTPPTRQCTNSGERPKNGSSISVLFGHAAIERAFLGAHGQQHNRKLLAPACNSTGGGAAGVPRAELADVVFSKMHHRHLNRKGAVNAMVPQCVTQHLMLFHTGKNTWQSF
eukprot:CAMPEP_0174363340 /NCGR_PEP_ID=MMETSP0811_2-20130205/68444_1 /TAXON_ID=73025 ORGANISM="Eutreptiella gymnastica-like, Strain CCMP1594" /NCGR_SAMPLE_ID=MMETSP0811_2 /ASSEMBLY_ACC=CAM_ASM_000667 /LENGTH=215 /DNA_ID=CAMNT_0015501951 /DNA_START=91 /DNA_END=738 /DNA_ORIENTATION=+